MHLKARKMHIKAFSFASNNRKTRMVLSPSANSELLIPQSTAVRQATQTIALETIATSLGSTAHHYWICRRRRDPQQRILSVRRLPSRGPARVRSNALEKTFSPIFIVLIAGQIQNKISNAALITELFAKLSAAQVPVVSSVFEGTDSYGKLRSESACQTKLPERWLCIPIQPCGRGKALNQWFRNTMSEADHILYSFPPLITDWSPTAVTSICYFQHIYLCSIGTSFHRAQVMLKVSSGWEVTQVAHSALRAGFVLNEWWLRLVWFCYSRSPQLERITSVSTARTEVRGYSCTANRPVPPFLICKYWPTPWVVLHRSSAATHLL